MNIKTLSPIALAAVMATGLAYGAAHTGKAMPASAAMAASGVMTPAKGEGPPSKALKPDNNARADVKAEATAANKAGEIKKGADVPAKPAPAGEKSRAEVKADAASAVKAGAIGKGPDVPASGMKK